MRKLDFALHLNVNSKASSSTYLILVPGNSTSSGNLHIFVPRTTELQFVPNFRKNKASSRRYVRSRLYV